ncbi:MAG: type II toxin-antitoxin system prevent-host-death family antitoxin [Clostridiales bacterium]|nr:type II toxin-antitoxin system prevent-host-death family antitoxin [Clostridiales bacterium]
MRVGIREVKNGLSRYLKYVKNGESIIITERNNPIAKIIPIDDNLLPEYGVLIKEGTLSWSGGKPQGSAEKKSNTDKQIAEYVTEDRR